MRVQTRTNTTSQSGIALAIVVWFLAAMSLLVSGIVFQARVDTRMAQIHVTRAKVEAAGDGAIQLMLAALNSRDKSRAGEGDLPVGNFILGELSVTVQLVPVSGLIDLNRASQDLLRALFVVHGGLSEQDAQYVADNVLKWRSVSGRYLRRGAGGSHFDSVEDLLKVEGVSRTVLDGIRHSVVVSKSSRRGQTNWALAPEAVLQVLGQADPEQAAKISDNSGGLKGLTARGRNTGGKNEKTTSVSGQSFRADAIVQYGDKTLLRRRWVEKGNAEKSSRLPWRYTRTESARVVNAASILGASLGMIDA